MRIDSLSERQLFWRLCETFDLVQRNRESQVTVLLEAMSEQERAAMIAMCEEMITWLRETNEE